MSQQHTTRLVVLIDNTWRLANAIPDTYDTNTGNIQVELNGMVVAVLGGQWFNVPDDMSDEDIKEMTIQNNVDLLFQISNQKISHRKNEERRNARIQQEEARAQVLARIQELSNLQPLPFPAEPQIIEAQPQPVVLQQPPVVANDDDWEPYGYDDYDCNCDLCRRNRGEE